MGREWYVQIGSDKFLGPISTQMLAKAAKTGRVRPETLVRLANSENWRPAGDIQGINFGIEPRPSDGMSIQPGGRDSGVALPERPADQDSVVVNRGIFGRRSVSYDCPSCGDRLRSPESKVRETDQCPECGAEFIVPGLDELRDAIRGDAKRALEQRRRKEQQRGEKRRQKGPRGGKSTQSAPETAISLAKLPSPSELGSAPHSRSPPLVGEIEEDRRKACPFCAEEIAVNAVKCKHCGEFLEPPLRAERSERIIREAFLAPSLAAKRYPGPTCPKCGATNPSIVKKGFGCGAAGCGVLIIPFLGIVVLGPLGFVLGIIFGVLVGFVDSNRRQACCLQCGKSWFV